MIRCAMCEELFEYNAVVPEQNPDGTLSPTVPTTVVLVVNAAGNDYDPLFFHWNICAGAWAMAHQKRLTRPSTWPARYYEVIDEEPDPQQRAEVVEQKQTNQVASLQRRSRLQ